MAELPYTDESARAILAIFKKFNIRENGALQTGQLQHLLSNDGRYRAEDFAAGLSYAIEKGWLIQEYTKVKLTATGFREM